MKPRRTEHPIIFSRDMVRAILAGRKTVTRRVLVPQPVATALATCPYGVPGDTLYVRENWRVRADQDETPNAGLDPSRDSPWYDADDDSQPSGCAGGAGRLRQSIFMPRWASRIVLPVIDVSVQRLHDITDTDARLEGMPPPGPVQGKLNGDPATLYLIDPRDAYSRLWDAINAKRGYSWISNPWVWRIEFSAPVMSGGLA